jgi:hypothetical protein
MPSRLLISAKRDRHSSGASQLGNVIILSGSISNNLWVLYKATMSASKATQCLRRAKCSLMITGNNSHKRTGLDQPSRYPRKWAEYGETIVLGHKQYCPWGIGEGADSITTGKSHWLGENTAL